MLYFYPSKMDLMGLVLSYSKGDDSSLLMSVLLRGFRSTFFVIRHL